jgi:hypothetical protein
MNEFLEVCAGLFGLYLLINIGGGLLYDRYFGDGSINRDPPERMEPLMYDRHEPK